MVVSMKGPQRLALAREGDIHRVHRARIALQSHADFHVPRHRAAKLCGDEIDPRSQRHGAQQTSCAR